jgi:hypothetical protein
MLNSKILQTTLTGVCGLTATLVVWILIVTLLDRRLSLHSNLFWTSSLWFSAVSCTTIVAYSRFAARPVLSCTIAFAIFALAYMACEGPIFGDVKNGGNPTTTSVVVWNLVFLPLGVSVATEIGAQLGNRSRQTQEGMRTDGRTRAI